MQTLIPTLRAPFNLINYDVGFRQTVGAIQDIPNSLRDLIKLESVISDIIAALVVLILTSLIFKPARSLVKKFLRWLISKTGIWAGLKKDEVVTREEDDEIRYLIWLKDDLKERRRQWHKSTIVPTPAHTKEPLDPQVIKAQRGSYSRYDPDDYLRNPALKEVPVSTRAEFGGRVKIKDLVKELKRSRTIIVLGDSGSGKSVCLRQLAYDLCEKGLARGGRPRTLPIHMEMGAYDGWADEAARKPTPIIEFLKNRLGSDRSISEAPTTHPLLHIPGRLEEILKAGRATVIFDALDEMPQDSYHERYDTLKTFVRAHGANRFIFSCRTLDYDPSFQVNEIIIDPFIKRIRTFLRINAPHKADKLYQRILTDEALKDLVSNPFFLQALAYINQGPLGDDLLTPTTRGELIRKFVDKLLDEDVKIKQEKYLSSIAGGLATLRSFLSELAFTLQQRREGRTSAQTESLQDVWQNYPQWKQLLWISRRARSKALFIFDCQCFAAADPVPSGASHFSSLVG